MPNACLLRQMIICSKLQKNECGAAVLDVSRIIVWLCCHGILAIILISMCLYCFCRYCCGKSETRDKNVRLKVIFLSNNFRYRFIIGRTEGNPFTNSRRKRITTIFGFNSSRIICFHVCFIIGTIV